MSITPQMGTPAHANNSVDCWKSPLINCTSLLSAASFRATREAGSQSPLESRCRIALPPRRALFSGKPGSRILAGSGIPKSQILA